MSMARSVDGNMLDDADVVMSADEGLVRLGRKSGSSGSLSSDIRVYIYKSLLLTSD